MRCEAKGPYVPICPYDVLVIRTVTPEEKTKFLLVGRLILFVHGESRRSSSTLILAGGVVCAFGLVPRRRSNCKSNCADEAGSHLDLRAKRKECSIAGNRAMRSLSRHAVCSASEMRASRDELRPKRCWYSRLASDCGIKPGVQQFLGTRIPHVSSIAPRN